MASSKRKTNVYETLLSRDELCEVIANKLHTSAFDLLETSIGPMSEDQLGFMGDHLKLKASIRLHDGSKKQHLQVFAKTVPQLNESFREYVDQIQGFKKEIGFFSDLLPDLKKYLIKNKEVLEADQERSNPGFWTCDCYFARSDFLVLEDLFALGFQQVDSRATLDYDHCTLMMQTLGRFHAASIIFEEKHPKTSGKTCQIIDMYRDIFFETEWVTTEGHPGNKFMKSSIKAIVSMAELLPKYGKNHENFEDIRKKLPSTVEQMCENVKPSTKFRNVVCHGDLWVSNIFFKYNKENKPIEAQFVDFQLIRYNPPASEIMWFLHLVTRKDFREANMDAFLTAYYDSFSSELRRHKLNPDELLSWSELKESCDSYRNAGRLAAAMYFQQCMMTGEYLKTVFSDPHHMITFQTVDKSKYVVECYHDDPVFRERNTEVVEELIEHCILNK